MTIFRYQDDEGRGPFRPGMTERWLVDHESKPVGLINERGVWGVRGAIDRFIRLNRMPHQFGFGCETLDCLFRWFTQDERKTLNDLGYRIVAMMGDRILGNQNEVLFARRLPLSRRAVILTIE